MVFTSRADAGRRLAHRLSHLRGCDAVVLAVASGGAPVALEVARALDLPMDIVVTERFEDPYTPGLTLGAVAEGGIAVFDASALRRAGVSAGDLAQITTALAAGVEKRGRTIRAGRAPITLTRRVALVVDDGLVTGTSARAAARVARARGAQRVVLAVPLAAADAAVSLADEIEETVCVERLPWVPAISRWYRDYPSATDETATEILRLSGSGRRVRSLGGAA